MLRVRRVYSGRRMRIGAKMTGYNPEEAQRGRRHDEDVAVFQADISAKIRVLSAKDQS
jgi:hypothetical protein